MIRKCPNDGGALVQGKAEHSRHVGEYAFSVKLPALVCRRCKESFVEGKDLAHFESRVAWILAEAGINNPEVLRFLRKAMGLQAKEFARLLGVRAETVSRWEQGKSPMDRASYAVVRQILLDRLDGRTQMEDYLQSLEKPTRLAKQVQVRLSKTG